LRPQNARGQTVIINAAPRRDSIVLSSLRIRVRLRSDSAFSDDQQPGQQQEQQHTQNSNSPGSVVVRRRDRILIAQPTRALVLRFRTLRDCLDFCDRLVELNPVSLDRPVPSVSTAVTDIPVNSGILTTATNTQNNNHTVNQTREILSCVGRLLCDPDFSHLVNRLEEVVMQSEDGRSMLEALVAQKESSNELLA
jgi:hypothetical protein